MAENSAFRYILESLIDLLLEIKLFHDVCDRDIIRKPSDKIEDLIFLLLHVPTPSEDVVWKRS